MTQELLLANEVCRSRLSPKRYIHTQGVVAEAAYLADRLELSDGERASLLLAATLHDITKELSRGEHIALCEEGGSPLSTDDLLARGPVHSRSAAVYAAKKFGASREVCDAIRRHTTGSPYMTLIDKLLYLSDYAEKNRTDEECVRIRIVLHNAMEETDDASARRAKIDCLMLDALDTTLSLLIAEKRYIHPETLQSRNRFLLINENA